MGDVSGIINGFKDRTSNLLTKTTFSDLVIHASDGNIQKSFPAHKLFLATSSTKFANMFYGPEGSNFQRILKINNYHPDIVHMMLEFLYTDSTDIGIIENAQELLRLAKEYQIEDLEKFCIHRLFEEPVTLENLFQKYEFALSEDIPQILKTCRNFVLVQTRAVLNSMQFIQASGQVVGDILSQNSLSIVSELEIINSAIKWAEHESVCKNESLRICIYPLFQHLRFLALTIDEFSDFVGKHCDLLNAHESNVITQLLVKPEWGYARLPSGFSRNTNPREFPEPSVALTENNPPSVLDSSQTFDQKLVSISPESASNFPQNKRPEFKKQRSEVKPLEIPIKTYQMNTSKFTSAAVLRNNDIDSISNKFSSTRLVNSYPMEYKNAKLQEVVKPAFMPMPTYVKKQSSGMCVPLGQRRHFEFPLVNMQMSPKSAFKCDIISYIDIFMRRGSMEIYGIELKILNGNGSETIKAFLTVNQMDILHEYNEKVKNDIYSIYFPAPWKLSERENIKIEVFLEELVLNRCMGIDCSQRYELNNGLGINAEIISRSNQPDESGSGTFYYSITRLLYKPC